MLYEIPTLWKANVMMKVCIGFTFGRTAKTVSPTRPLEDDATPSELTANPEPNFLASKNVHGKFHQMQPPKNP